MIRQKKSMSFDDTVIVTLKGHDYRINFWFKTKIEVVGRMKNADLKEKSGQL